MTEEVGDWWELSAEWFQDDIDLDVGVNWTGTSSDTDLGLLSDVEGAEILELGCGGGQCTVALAKRRADVTGIDLSEEQLFFARGLVDEHGVDIGLPPGDVTDLGMFPDDYEQGLWAKQSRNPLSGLHRPRTITVLSLPVRAWNRTLSFSPNRGRSNGERSTWRNRGRTRFCSR